MITIAGGDSFIFGSELKDAGKTFTQLLANQHGEYISVAHPGYANESITRTVVAECFNHVKPIVIVCWTFPGRYEFRFSYDTGNRTSPWYAFNHWTTADVDKIKSELHLTNSYVTRDLEFAVIKAKQNGLANFVSEFYKHVGASEYWEIYSSLKEVVYLQNFLKQQKISYLFTCADNSILYNWTLEQNDRYINSLYTQIDFQNWFWFPEGADKKPRGFYQWAAENKFPFGALHPLEEAHHGAFLLLKEKFNELVEKNME